MSPLVGRRTEESRDVAEKPHFQPSSQDPPSFSLEKVLYFLEGGREDLGNEIASL